MVSTLQFGKLMATKAKQKAKAIKKVAKRSPAAVKSIGLKAKAGKFASRNGSHPPAKSLSAQSTKRTQKMESRRTSVESGSTADRSVSPSRARSKHFANAVQ